MVIQRLKDLFIFLEGLGLIGLYLVLCPFELLSEKMAYKKRLKCEFGKHVWIDEWIVHVRFRQKCKNCGMLLSDYLCGVRK